VRNGEWKRWLLWTLGGLVVVAVLAGGIAASAISAQNVDDRRQAAAAKTAAQESADAALQAEEDAEGAARQRRFVREETRDLCAGKLDADEYAYLDDDVERRASKQCPDALEALNKKLGGGSEEAEPYELEGSDPYCYAAYNLALDGNGPGSDYSDYTDEEIAQAEADFAKYCQGYEHLG
jgi:hypothetical protein